MSGQSTIKELPDDIWIRIFQIGLEKSNFGTDDLSCLSGTCKNFRRLSEEDLLWSTLVNLEFSCTDILDCCECTASSKKDKYKCLLKRKIRQQIIATRFDVARINRQLEEAENAIVMSSYVTTTTLSKKLEKLAREFVEYIPSVMGSPEAINLLEERWLVKKAKSEKFKEHFKILHEKIKVRLHGESSAAAASCSAPPAFVSSDVVNLVDAFIDCVEIKLRDLLGDKQNSQKEVDRLYRYRGERLRRLAALTSRLAAIRFPDGGVNEVVVTDIEVAARMNKLSLIDCLFGG